MPDVTPPESSTAASRSPGDPPPDDRPPSYARELEVAIAAARAGAAAILPVYRSPGFAAEAKGDGSPVTVADLASDAAIRAVIVGAFPDDGLLTEEGLDDGRRLGRSRVWIADPLDGTREFVARTDDFDVFVGLVVEGVPVVAVEFPAT